MRCAAPLPKGLGELARRYGREPAAGDAPLSRARRNAEAARQSPPSALKLPTIPEHGRFGDWERVGCSWIGGCICKSTKFRLRAACNCRCARPAFTASRSILVGRPACSLQHRRARWHGVARSLQPPAALHRPPRSPAAAAQQFRIGLEQLSFGLQRAVLHGQAAGSDTGRRVSCWPPQAVVAGCSSPVEKTETDQGHRAPTPARWLKTSMEPGVNRGEEGLPAGNSQPPWTWRRLLAQGVRHGTCRQWPGACSSRAASCQRKPLFRQVAPRQPRSRAFQAPGVLIRVLVGQLWRSAQAPRFPRCRRKIRPNRQQGDRLGFSAAAAPPLSPPQPAAQRGARE